MQLMLQCASSGPPASLHTLTADRPRCPYTTKHSVGNNIQNQTKKWLCWARRQPGLVCQTLPADQALAPNQLLLGYSHTHAAHCVGGRHNHLHTNTQQFILEAKTYLYYKNGILPSFHF